MWSSRLNRFSQFTGQDRITALLKQECKATSPRHTLLVGPPGLGKTTLAGIMAHEAGLELVKVQAGKLTTPKGISNLLMGLGVNGYDSGGRPNKIKYNKYLIFIDECHALADFEQWYGVLTSRELNPDPYGGVSWLPYITIVAATNYPNRLPRPFRDRFSLQLRLEPYGVEDLRAIIRASYPKLDSKLVAMAVDRARGSARTALDLAETIKRHGSLELIDLDDRGLTPIDHRYLEALRTAGRPLSLSTIAGMIQEDQRVVSEEIEPYLLKLGLIARTSKGRELLGVGVSRGTCLTTGTGGVYAG